jgi:hypothetical protein
MQTVEEIYDEITASQTVQSSLSDLDATGDTAVSLLADVGSGSKVGRHRLIKWVVAYAMWTQRVLWEIFRIDTKALAKDGHFGTKRWLVAKALAFQYGDDLVFTPLDATYDPIDASAQIVAKAAVTELAYKAIVKAVKQSGTGYTVLTSDERNGLQDYFDELKPPMNIEVRSALADKARIYGTVVCDAKQGIPQIQSNAEAAIVQYIADLDFNGVFSINKMREAVLDIAGVIDFLVVEVGIRIDGNTTFVNVPRVYSTYAGHMVVDSSHALSQTLEFKSSNV